MTLKVGNDDSISELSQKVIAPIKDTGNVLDQLRALQAAHQTPVDRINFEPERVEKGMAQLVLTIMELLYQLMERQALRRVEGGSLTDDEVERLGLAFMQIDQRIEELVDLFGIRREDLNLDLGPLGNLM